MLSIILTQMGQLDWLSIHLFKIVKAYFIRQSTPSRNKQNTFWTLVMDRFLDSPHISPWNSCSTLPKMYNYFETATLQDTYNTLHHVQKWVYMLSNPLEDTRDMVCTWWHALRRMTICKFWREAQLKLTHRVYGTFSIPLGSPYLGWMTDFPQCKIH